MLPHEERLKRRKDFESVYGRARPEPKSGGATRRDPAGKSRSWANTLLVLYVRRHVPPDVSAETRRFGFSVSKKVGKAHERNLIKRRLREICREEGNGWTRGFDAVFIARSAAATASFSDLKDAVCQLVGRAKLIADVRDVPASPIDAG